jgi:hypothetical protein
MNALKKRNPLTESFLVQLDVDLEALGVRIPKLRSAFPRSSDTPGSPLPPGLKNARKAGERHDIMGYSNQCNFMKVPGDDGNPATAPNIIDIDAAGPPGAANYSPSHQPTTLPTRDRSHTGPYLPSHSLAPPPFSTYGPPPEMDTGSSNDLSGTSPDGNGRTPNSSTTGGSSDPQRQNLAPTTSNGHVNGGSGRDSFETSPASSHQNINSMPGTAPGDVERNVNAFFGANPSSFGMSAGVSTGLTPDQRFTMTATGDTPSSRGPGGSSASGDGSGEFPGHTAPTWADISGQQGMTPVAEGVLRSMMGMGPIDGMDMGWEPSG